jgi:hypothetical protein
VHAWLRTVPLAVMEEERRYPVIRIREIAEKGSPIPGLSRKGVRWGLERRKNLPENIGPPIFFLVCNFSRFFFADYLFF